MPLLPKQPPARSIACCLVLVVNTLKITGISPFKLSSVIPCVTPLHTYVKCGVSP